MLVLLLSEHDGEDFESPLEVRLASPAYEGEDLVCLLGLPHASALNVREILEVDSERLCNPEEAVHRDGLLAAFDLADELTGKIRPRPEVLRAQPSLLA